MSDKRVQLNKLVKDQLPSYVKEDFPLIGEFLTQYYLGQEYQGAPADLLENIDKYIKLDECGDVVNSTTLYRKMRMNDTYIVVVDTEGFPESNGLIRIEDEIIHYSDLKNINIKFDFCVVATSAEPRYSLMLELLKMDIKFFLIEKVVFQSEYQFDKIVKLAKTKK